MRALVGTPAPPPGTGVGPAVRTAPDAEPSPWVPGMRAPAPNGAGHRAAGHGFRAGPAGRFRWDPGRRGVAALGLAVIAVLAATAWWLATGRPHAVPVRRSAPGPSPVSVTSSVAGPAAPSSTSPTPAASAPASPTATASVVVDVAGKVRRPGVYTLPSGARVYEALRAAGGVRRGASTVALNLAAPLVDGEQIVVGIAAAGPVGGVGPIVGASPTGGSLGSATAPATVINLNTATLEQLESLPGVGPVLGQNILDWRNANGQFTSVDQLREVSGIGDVRMAQLRPLVTV